MRFYVRILAFFSHSDIGACPDNTVQIGIHIGLPQEHLGHEDKDPAGNSEWE